VGELPLLTTRKRPHRSFFNPEKAKLMKTLTKLGCPLVVAAALALSSIPAHAQLFKEEDFGQAKQFAPMFEMMKKTMGKKRYAALMRKMGPMMARMGESGNGFGGGLSGGGDVGGYDLGGFSGGKFSGFSGGDFGGIANMVGSGRGMGDLRSMISGFTGRHGRRSWRARHSGGRWF
jgi:hypothetical protein